MFNALVAYYMFLGGAGAGVFVVCSLLSFFVPLSRVVSSRGGLAPSRQYRALLGGGYAASIVLTVAGCLCLLADLGQPERAVYLFLRPSWSYISLGTFALAFQVVCAVALSFAWAGYLRGLKVWAVRAVQAFGLVVAFVVMVYAGLLLQSVKAVALWSSTSLMPFLFVVSSLVSGMAAFNATACLLGCARPFSGLMTRLMAADIVCMVIEALLVVGLLVVAFKSGVAGRASVEALLTGRLAGMFWLCMVLIGLLIPPTLEVLTAPRFSTGVMLTTSLMVLTGGFALRVCLIEAGVNPLVMLGVG